MTHATHYQITPFDPHAHLFEVKCTISEPDPAGQRLRLPAWIPGSYKIREFARKFIGVRAESAGRAVAITKEAKDVWRASPADAPLTVVATVYAFDLSVRTAYLDSTRAYFNGAALFLSPEGREEAPCTVDIVAPAGAAYSDWRVATTLDPVDVPPHGFGRYRADDYEALVDHPVEIGTFALFGFTAGGVRHDVALTGRQNADLERLGGDLGRVCQAHCDMFEATAAASAPFARYLFLVTAVGDGHGGLEHRSSASLICRRDDLPRPGDSGIPDGYLHLLGLASHEYFHGWNVKRIKPAAFVPYDLSRETYTRQLWAFEGITSYYDDLALVRSGLIDPPRYLELLGRTITSVLRTPGRHRQSLAESSFDAWIKFYRPDEDTPNAGVSYYAKGAVVALAIDLTLRTLGRGSLDAVMRAIWNRHGKTGVGLDEDGFERIAEEISGTDLGDFFARYVHGTEDPPLGTLLREFGIDWHVRAPAGADDRGGGPAATASHACSLGATIGSDLRLAHVYSGGAAERAGLAANDCIVAIDGIRASPGVIESLLARGTPGASLRVHAFRRDELMEFDVVLAEAAPDTCYLTMRPGTSVTVTARRDAWLAGP